MSLTNHPTSLTWKASLRFPPSRLWDLVRLVVAKRLFGKVSCRPKQGQAIGHPEGWEIHSKTSLYKSFKIGFRIFSDITLWMLESTGKSKKSIMLDTPNKRAGPPGTTLPRLFMERPYNACISPSRSWLISIRCNINFPKSNCFSSTSKKITFRTRILSNKAATCSQRHDS